MVEPAAGGFDVTPRFSVKIERGKRSGWKICTVALQVRGPVIDTVAHDEFMEAGVVADDEGRRSRRGQGRQVLVDLLDSGEIEVRLKTHLEDRRAGCGQALVEMIEGFMGAPCS